MTIQTQPEAGRASDQLKSNKKTILKPNVITPKNFKVKEIVQKLARREEMFFDLT
jgi:hypothetical protein